MCCKVWDPAHLQERALSCQTGVRTISHTPALTQFCNQNLGETLAYQSGVEILCLLLQLLFPNVSPPALWGVRAFPHPHAHHYPPVPTFTHRLLLKGVQSF